MKRKVSLIVMMLLLYSSVLLSSSFEVIPTKVEQPIIVPKDPIIAGLLSAQYTGLGQIYCRKYVRGITFFMSELGSFALASAIAGMGIKEYSYMVIDNNGEEHRLTRYEIISKWDELSGISKTGVVSLVITGIGIHIWNVIDAYQIAYMYSWDRLSWIRAIDIQISYKYDSPLLKVAVSKDF
ncbi:MAG: hypothetical protein HY769_09605 [Candidatus Stahlbacteria bacterium]|nr:hypothetical protein [Candidatus Stahlbacteria bacterium]